ncbi:MAG: DUF4038 domain-containing protein [Verrucomicrobiota bacterium]
MRHPQPPKQEGNKHEKHPARKPTKPIRMAEGAYERGSEYEFEVTPLWIRRQAYYWYLAGAHHAYGHNDSWRVLPTWKEALDAPGATQLGILKSFDSSASFGAVTDAELKL